MWSSNCKLTSQKEVTQWFSADLTAKTQILPYFDANGLTLRDCTEDDAMLPLVKITALYGLRRSFPLTEEAREIFLAAKAAEEENRRLFRKSYKANDYIFKWSNGTPFAPDYVTHHFAKVLKQNGLPHIRFHELRHSCATAAQACLSITAAA